jgi:hypothetical protein
MANMAKKISIIMLLALCLWSVSGGVVSAALVNCGQTAGDKAGIGADSNTPAALGCGFADAVAMINTLIKYLIMISMPLAAIAFAYAGWLYLSAGENTSNVTKARTIFLDVGIGVIIILSGWLVFTLIAQTFLKTTSTPDNPGDPYGTYLK